MSNAVFDLVSLLRSCDRDLPRDLIERYNTEVDAGEHGDRRMIALLNYVFSKFHIKRNELNMYRDMAKVASMLAMRVSDKVLPVDLALDECDITSYDIIDEILRVPPPGFASLDDFLNAAGTTARLDDLRAMLSESLPTTEGRSFAARYCSRVFYASVKRYLVALGINCEGYFRTFAPNYEKCDEDMFGELLKRRAAVKTPSTESLRVQPQTLMLDEIDDGRSVSTRYFVAQKVDESEIPMISVVEENKVEEEAKKNDDEVVVTSETSSLSGRSVDTFFDHTLYDNIQ